jgi:uncharacterized protein YoxC
MLNTHDDEQTASETLDEVGEAIKKDASTTVEHVKDAASDIGNAVENEAEEHGLNNGDPDRNDD